MSEALESVLGGLSIFELLRPDEIGRVAARFETHDLAEGATFEVTADAPRLVVVATGSADLEVDLGHAKTRARIGEGDRWGDVQLLTGHARAAKITAVHGSTLATIDRAGFDALLADFPAIGMPLARELASHLRTKNDERRQILELHAEGLAKDQLQAAIDERRQTIAERGARVSRLSPRAIFQKLVVRTGAEPPFWMMVGFLSSLGGARMVVALILKYGLEKRLFALVHHGNDPNPMHVHHFNYGLIVASISGIASLFPFGRRALRLFAATFGIGIGLIFDEFALIWTLNPEYSQSLSLISAAIAFVVLLNLVYFRAFWGSLVRRLANRVRT
jgi:CRP-like cAMP-binding protein